ncbi:MAG: NCS2 family permease [Planctomycetota bacterium]|nr:NCS2 family permease [Planctomycetota bacterium]
MRWFVRGDVDGFFGLAVDNLIQLLLINELCQGVIGMGPELVYGRVLPGAAVSLLVGNLFYAWQARQVARAEGREDVCALPYGINTPSVFVYLFAVMLPAKLAAQQAGAADPAYAAWQAGLVACLGSGLIEFGGAFVAEWLRKATPRAALLATLSGIALTFISLDFLFRAFAAPVVGLSTLGVLAIGYFGRVKFKGGLPAGFVAMLLGVALCWLTGLAPDGSQQLAGVSFYAPVPVLGELWAALQEPYAKAYFSVILPMGVFNVVGSMQNIESAEAAGDGYSTRGSLAVNGLGTLAAACFGSCFPTTIYIGHPGWKAMGARAGYSILNAGFMTLLCLTGTLAYVAWAVPIEAGMAIVLYIGIVISAQAFQSAPSRHAPAAVLGIMVGVGAYVSVRLAAALRVAGRFETYDRALYDAFRGEGVYFRGALALEQGMIFSAMILAAAFVEVIERRWRRAALWCLGGAGLCAVGLMHAYVEVPGGGAGIDLRPAFDRPWMFGYLILAACFFATPWLTEPKPAEPSVAEADDAPDRAAS